MKNLFIIYIGGSHKGSLIELHDMRFMISDTIENTYDALRKSWWGIPETLHLDAWGILNWADGYKIEIVDSYEQTLIQNRERLYFINLGGYCNKQFTELHKNIFVVAKNNHEAKIKAMESISKWQSPHKDNLFDIDNILDVNSLVKGAIKLTACNNPKDFEFTCKYTPIGKIH